MDPFDIVGDLENERERKWNKRKIPCVVTSTCSIHTDTVLWTWCWYLIQANLRSYSTQHITGWGASWLQSNWKDNNHTRKTQWASPILASSSYWKLRLPICHNHPKVFWFDSEKLLDTNLFTCWTDLHHTNHQTSTLPEYFPRIFDSGVALDGTSEDNVSQEINQSQQLLCMNPSFSTYHRFITQVHPRYWNQRRPCWEGYLWPTDTVSKLNLLQSPISQIPQPWFDPYPINQLKSSLVLFSLNTCLLKMDKPPKNPQESFNEDGRRNI